MTSRASAGSTPRTARRGWSTDRARGRRSPPCCSATAPAAASTPATSRRWRDDLPRNGVTVVLLEQPWRVAGRKVATPPPTLDDGLVAAANGLRTRTPAGRRRPLRRRPVGGPLRPAARRGRLPGAGLPAAPARASRRSRGSHELRGARRADAGRPGRARHHGPARGVPRPTSTWPSCPAPTTASRCPPRAGVTEAEAMEIVVEATLEWIVREVTGGGRAAREWPDDRRCGVLLTMHGSARTPHDRATLGGDD